MASKRIGNDTADIILYFYEKKSITSIWSMNQRRGNQFLKNRIDDFFIISNPVLGKAPILIRFKTGDFCFHSIQLNLSIMPRCVKALMSVWNMKQK